MPVKGYTDALMSVRRHVYWTAADTIVTAGIGFVLRLIIARVLAPDDFGIAMLAVTIITVIQAVNEFGLTSALIQRDGDQMSRDLVDTTFTASLIVTLVMTAVTVGIVAPLGAAFYEEPSLHLLIVVLGLTLLPSPFSTVASAMLYRRQNFKSIAIVKVAANCIGFVTAIVLLMLEPSPWVIIAQATAALAASAVGLQWLAKLRYRLRLHKSHLRAVFSFSGKIFVNNMAVSLSANAGVFILGRAVSVADAGLYALAVYITDTLRRILMSILNRVMFVHYSANKTDLERLARKYIETIRWNCRIVFPAMTLIIFFGPALTVPLLGDAWGDMQSVLIWLSVSVMIHAAGGTTSTLFTAMGRPGLDMALFLLTTLLILFPGMIAGAALLGLTGVAIATAAAKLVSVIIRQIFVHRLIGTTTLQVIGVTAQFLLKQAPIALSFVAAQLIFDRPSLLVYVLFAAIGLCVYAAIELPQAFPGGLAKIRRTISRSAGDTG